MKFTKFIKFINPLESPDGSSPDRYSLDDKGIGNALADSVKGVLRYVADAKSWFYYTGVIWRKDHNGLRARELAKDYHGFLKTVAKEIKLKPKAMRSNEEYNFLEIVEDLSKNGVRKKMLDEAMSVHPLNRSDFDVKMNLLNCLNCTINLDNGNPHEHNPEDFITKVAQVHYDKTVKFPRWDKFISEIMCEEVELERYLKKSYGYGITGETKEECMFMEHGPSTRNGKGTLKESTMNVLGDYALNMQPDSLAKRKRNGGSGATPDIARNAGVRFVNVNEPDEDMVLDAALIKQLTGSDTITARFLYGNNFDFIPQFKIYVSTNHLPTTTDDTLFSSGRIKVIPFNRHFKESEQDRTLKSLFRTDECKSAILNWLLEGLKMYKDEGLIPPASVQIATSAYRRTTDTVVLFIEDATQKNASAKEIKTSEVYPLYKEWCAVKKLTPVTAQRFVGNLRNMGYVKRNAKDGHVVRGLDLNYN